MSRYKVSNKEMAKGIVFKEWLFLGCSLVSLTVVFVLPVYSFYFGSRVEDSEIIQFYLQYSFIIVLSIFFMYSAIKMRRMRISYPIYLDLGRKGLTTVSSEGVEGSHQYKEFRDGRRVNIYFSDERNRSFHSMKDFVREGVPYIENVMQRTDKKKRVPDAVYIHILKPSKIPHTYHPYIWIHIHLSSIGGPENLNKMLNEWKYRYEEYLKGIGEYGTEQ